MAPLNGHRFPCKQINKFPCKQIALLLKPRTVEKKICRKVLKVDENSD